MKKLPYLGREANKIQRQKVTTNPAYGCRPEERTIEQALQLSFINVNKPKGPTSHQVSDYIKDILKIPKAGHGGTLDPAVTGVLPVGLNDAVKVIRTFLLAGKEYVCYMRIHADEFHPGQVKDLFKEFTGKIEQLPPKKSAVKREWRTREVYYLELLDHDGPNVLFKVGCQGGTYIRKLCTDMGEHLGCGAHMQQLVRTQAATFDWHTTHTLQDIQDAVAYHKEGNSSMLKNILIPIETAVHHLPKVWIGDEAVATMTHGAPLGLPGVAAYDDDCDKDMPCAVFSLKDELVAIGTCLLTQEQLKNDEKGKVVNVDRVIMRSGTYEK